MFGIRQFIKRNSRVCPSCGIPYRFRKRDLKVSYFNASYDITAWILHCPECGYEVILPGTVRIRMAESSLQGMCASIDNKPQTMLSVIRPDMQQVGSFTVPVGGRIDSLEPNAPEEYTEDAGKSMEHADKKTGESVAESKDREVSGYISGSLFSSSAFSKLEALRASLHMNIDKRGNRQILKQAKAAAKKFQERIPSGLADKFPMFSRISMQQKHSLFLSEEKHFLDEHVPHKQVIINDLVYDTDNSEMFLRVKGQYGLDNPCVHYNYHTPNNNFFRCTVRYRHEDSIRALDIIEAKRMLEEYPDLYRKFFPDSVNDA
jgi:hypothetical protein